MIRYSLVCADGHDFDSWFQSADAFDRLNAGGHVACAVCGSTEVTKSLMAPSVVGGRKAEEKASEPALNAPRNPVEHMLAELRRKIEASSEYVGMNFAAEARAIHEGEAPERPIYGEARLEDARTLIEDGVPVTPLPFLPTRKAN
ncbi:hypothetical protein LV82_01142 [Albidovulum inexpectatum]|uniref:DUF1178 family protein n=1 Tax=Albidovulum inexpectatum TaxID=196587 RepID=A0A2S5JI13_9RHOB|nr:DUF1178 family protein [Albidovulum inexpectatum]PPB81103.1 hypothetical protein LV82_01142 [Albidovulum inexpectatum]